MLISNVHWNSAIELRFTITDGDRESVRMIFPRAGSDALEITTLVANNINRYTQDKAAGFPYDYNSDRHIADIMANAARYGTD